MIKIENGTWGNPIVDIVSDLQELLTGKTDVHVSVERPTPQQKHKKHEIVIGVDGFIQGNDIAIRDYRVSIDVWSYSTLGEHDELIEFLDDALTNYVSTLFAHVETLNVQRFGVEVGETAYNSGLSVSFFRNVKNKTQN